MNKKNITRIKIQMNQLKKEKEEKEDKATKAKTDHREEKTII